MEKKPKANENSDKLELNNSKNLQENINIPVGIEKTDKVDDKISTADIENIHKTEDKNTPADIEKTDKADDKNTPADIENIDKPEDKKVKKKKKKQ